MGAASRRKFLSSSIEAAGAGFLGLALPSLASAADKPEKEKIGVKAFTAVEGLQREHGALLRILFIYEEAQRRIRAKEDFDPGLVAKAAKIVRDFIENYHEVLEEGYLFPRMREAVKEVELVDTLTKQHASGRILTQTILTLSTPAHLKVESDRSKLAGAMGKFVTMYGRHGAWEDTVLFPGFKTIVTPMEYDQLGVMFEKKERELFGKGGFKSIVDEIASIEKPLGISKLSKFTATGD